MTKAQLLKRCEFWEQRYKTIQEAFMQLAAGNGPAYEQRIYLERQIDAFMRSEERMIARLEAAEDEIKRLKGLLEKRRKK